MNRNRLVLLAAAVILIVASWWQVLAARGGFTVRHITRDGVPMVYLAPAVAQRAPGLLVAHGFAGSKQLMLAYGYTLAHAGYAVLLWDFGGHGANGNALAGDSLQDDLDRAYAVLIEQPEVDPARLALLGHSMGSGAVMAAGIRNPNRYTATIAISPTGADVSPAAPRNLLLQAGGWEGNFAANARRLLAAAGGAGDDFANGRARRLIVVPNAEHISILFRSASSRAVLDWLARAFGEARDTPYVDRRIIWYAVSLLGWLLALAAAAPRLQPAIPERPSGRRWLPWAGLAVAPLIASAALVVANRTLSLADFGGLRVGGAVGLWFLVAGLVWLACNLPARRPSRSQSGLGAGAFRRPVGGLRRAGAERLAAMVADRAAPVALADPGAGVPAMVHGVRPGAAGGNRRRPRALVAGAKRRRRRRADAPAGAGAFVGLPADPAAADAAAARHPGRRGERVGPRVALRHRRRAFLRLGHRRRVSVGGIRA